VHDRPLQLLNAAVAPNEHAGGQVIPVWCSLRVFAVTDAALPVRGFPMENAIAMHDLFSAESGWHRQGVGRGPYLLPEYAERRRNELELLLALLPP
jgi:hypothetical protein